MLLFCFEIRFKHRTTLHNVPLNNASVNLLRAVFVFTFWICADSLVLSFVTFVCHVNTITVLETKMHFWCLPLHEYHQISKQETRAFEYIKCILIEVTLTGVRFYLFYLLFILFIQSDHV